ncbi:MAG: hypothetical protein AB7S86_05805 [Hydrogenophaga sp.]|uniref:hypothetical protein n=1 Tax=Hydrogenophaga sp. TaxID=1904254 RepID=UPI003D0D1F96
MYKKIKGALLAGALVACALLTACGGGGGDESLAPSAAVIDKYLGEWSYPCETVSSVPGSERSTRRAMTVTKLSSISFDVALVELSFSSLDCSGGSMARVFGTARMSHTGTRVVGVEVVDTLVATGPSGSVKLLSLLKDGKLYGDDLSSPLDGDGYHTAIDFTDWATLN